MKKLVLPLLAVWALLCFDVAHAQEGVCVESLVSSDKTLEFTQKKLGDKCETISGRDPRTGIVGQTEDGKAFTTVISPAEIVEDPEVRQCSSMPSQGRSNKGGYSVTIEMWSTKTECTPAPVPGYPRRTLNLEVTLLISGSGIAGTVCLNPGNMCASIDRLSEDARRNIADMVIFCIFEQIAGPVLTPKQKT
ncbi:hypothetical protein EBR66_03085 [bacterium]|nr:hypothetical protein [bacterium]